VNPSSLQVPASTEAAESISAGQEKDTSGRSFVHQRPSSSSQHIRSATHRSALAANSGPATSTSGGTATDAAQKQSLSPPSVQSSKPASLSQDAEKSVSAIDVKTVFLRFYCIRGSFLRL